jgi:hypothetical protein
MASLCGGRRFASAVDGKPADTKKEHPDGQSRWEKGRVVRMKKDTFRVVTRGTDGQLRIRDYDSQEDLLRRHTQVGVDDCSTDLELRGLPVFRGLIGPMPDGETVIRYESPEVFETLTKEWSTTKTPRRTRTRPPASRQAGRLDDEVPILNSEL